jgi:hypothetical protein
VQDVEQVVVTPFWHLMHAATHCFKSLELYDGKRSLSHLPVLPVTSLAGEQEATARANAKIPMAWGMRPPKRQLRSRQISSDHRNDIGLNIGFKLADRQGITPYNWVHLDEEDRWWFSTSAIVNLDGPFPERMMDGAAIALAGRSSDSEIVIAELGRGLLAAIT